jgi:predicted dehydrogenase
MKILIAGFGSIGRRHFQNLLSLGEKDILFYRSRKSTLPDEILSGFRVEKDLEEALEQKPDAVVVSNPTALHLDVAIPAARQGCHILLEKPISNSMDRIDELKNAVKVSGSRILVGFQFRYHPGLKQIKKWIQQDKIGSIYYVRTHWGEYLPDWHSWEDYRESYSAREDLGGGVLLTLSHPIDYLRWIFGEFDSVSAKVGEQKALGIEVEEMVEATVRFQNGILGGMHLNYLQRPPEHSLDVIGSEGRISWNYLSGELKLYLAEEQTWEFYPLAEDFSRNDLFLAEMRHFLQVAAGKKAPLCSLDDGIKVQKIITALYQAAEDGTAASIL